MRLGQHFLKDLQIADRVVAAAGLGPGEDVVEIGPGRGVLTRRLLAAGARVSAIELDRRLCEKLRLEFRDVLQAPTFETRTASGSSSPSDGGRGLSLIQGDFLKLDLAVLPRRCIFVANLPYAVGAPILQRILSWGGPGAESPWTRAVLMFQKEVAERILAGPGSRKYGVLSLSVALKARARWVCSAPAGAFSPQPKVDSAVVRIDPLAALGGTQAGSPLPPGLPEEKFMRLVRAAFQHRRKRAANSIAQALKVPANQVGAALRGAGVSNLARAEEISLPQFIRMAIHLSEFI